MSEPNFITMYPKPGGKIDFFAGIRAWIKAGGKINSSYAFTLDSWDPQLADSVSHTLRSDVVVDESDVDALQNRVGDKCVQISLNAPFYTPTVETCYFDAGSYMPLIVLVYHYPTAWGYFLEGGVRKANAALHSMAKAAGAAYVMTNVTYGHDHLFKLFRPVDDKFEFFFNEELLRDGHSLISLDINKMLGGVLPAETPILRKENMSSGYDRYWLRGTFEAGVKQDQQGNRVGKSAWERRVYDWFEENG